MKHIIFFLLVSVCLCTATAQVGIATTSPQATLDVNGTVRVTTTDQASVTTTKLSGVDGSGNYREIAVGENLTLASNRLSTTNPFDLKFGSITLENDPSNNVDLLLESGEANEYKNIIRVFSTVGKVDITGMKAGYDGQHIWLYAQDDELKLQPNDASSLASNRIEANEKFGMKQWAVLELVYDGTRALWIIKQWHK